MPASRISLAVTEAYRERIGEIQRTIEASARLLWSRIPRENPDLDAEYETWLGAIVPAATAAQAEAVRISNGYLTAYLTSELGEPTDTEPAEGTYVGLSRDGRILRDALRSPLIGVKSALTEGKPLARALEIGQTRALRMLWLDLDQAARASLQDGLTADDRIEGWQRAVRGTCGACLGDIAVEVSVQLPEKPLLIHPNCQCVTQPVVVGAPDTFRLATGAQRFAQMTREDQDRELGPKAAEALRSGDVSLADLVGTSEQREAQNFITQAPVPAP